MATSALCFALPAPTPPSPLRKHRGQNPRRVCTQPTADLQRSASIPIPALLALDVGTGGSKAGAFCTETGALLSLRQAPHPTYVEGLARTQTVADWRASAAAALRAAAGAVSPSRPVAAVAITGSMQNLAAVDGVAMRGLAAGEVLLYSDRRAAAEARRLDVPAEGLLAKLAWAGAPPNGVRVALGAADLVVYDLCGALVTDTTNLSTTGLSLPPHRNYDLAGMRTAGVDAWALALPSVLEGPPSVVGSVSVEWATGLELPWLAGVPVVHAGGDAAATTEGAGDGGYGYVYLGTSGWVGRVISVGHDDMARKKNGVFYLPHPWESDKVMELGSMSAAGACLVWAGKALLGGIGVTEVLDLAAQAPIGANGVRATTACNPKYVSSVGLAGLGY